MKTMKELAAAAAKIAALFPDAEPVFTTVNAAGGLDAFSINAVKIEADFTGDPDAKVMATAILSGPKLS